MAGGQNRLEIYATSITLATPKGSLSGFSWDGTRLVHTTGKTMQFNATVSAEIAAAVAAAHGDVYEYRYARDIVDGDREGWEFCGDIEAVGNGAALQYRRKTAAAVYPVVRFSREDMVPA